MYLGASSAADILFLVRVQIEESTSCVMEPVVLQGGLTLLKVHVPLLGFGIFLALTPSENAKIYVGFKVVVLTKMMKLCIFVSCMVAGAREYSKRT